MNRSAIVMSTVAGALGLGIIAAASTGGSDSFDLPWYSIDGGGGASAGGAFLVEGTVGQADAGLMSGGEFDLAGGFWPGATTGGPADCNGDGQVGLPDYACFHACLGGPGAALPNGCDRFDFDADADTDMRDFAILQAAFD